MAEILKQLQDNSLIYGDLRPENILIEYQNTEVGDVRLVNCGQSTLLKNFEPIF